MVHTDDLYNLSNCNVSLNSMIHNSSFIRKTICHISTYVKSKKWDSENEKWNYVNSRAASGGHLDICRYSVSNGATYFKYSLINAAGAGHLDICKYLVSISTLNTDDFNKALINAARAGHLDICKYLVSTGTLNTDDLDEALINSTRYRGHLDICKYLVSQGATDYDSALINAARYGNLDICKYFMSIPSSNLDLDEALVSAARYSNLDTCKYLVYLGATDYGSALYYAKSRRHVDKDIYYYLLEQKNMN